MASELKPRILFVDDEPDVLTSIVRSLRSDQFHIVTALGGAAALDKLRATGPFTAIISDLRMPGMDGVSLLRQVREVYPDMVRVLFTGQPDMENAIAAVNDGAVFRFVTKPCSRVTLALTVRAAIEQNRLITAERELLERTLHGSIKALTDILALTNPMAFGRATRLRQTVAALASAQCITGTWHVEVAAMLSQIGAVILPNTILEKIYRKEPITEEETEMMHRATTLAEQLLANIPRLDPVLEILRMQDKHFDGSGPPEELPGGEQIPWGSRALKVARDFDSLESEGLPSRLALDTLRGREGWYDPSVLETLAELRKSEHRYEVRELPLANLAPGMILAQDVRTAKGSLFVVRGQEVTAGLIEKFRFSYPGLFGDEPIRVVIPNLPPAPPAGEHKA